MSETLGHGHHHGHGGHHRGGGFGRSHPVWWGDDDDDLDVYLSVINVLPGDLVPADAPAEAAPASDLDFLVGAITPTVDTGSYKAAWWTPEDEALFNVVGGVVGAGSYQAAWWTPEDEALFNEVVGEGFDIKRLTDTLNGIKVATVAQLGAIVSKAIEIEQLSVVAGTAGKLPGDDTRRALLARLVGHRAVLSQQVNQKALVVNPALAVVKQDLVAAAVDLNATAEGAQYDIDHAFSLLTDIRDSAADLIDKAGKAAEKATSWLSWLPWIIGGAALVAVVVIAGPIVVPVIVAKIQAGRK